VTEKAKAHKPGVTVGLYCLDCRLKIHGAEAVFGRPRAITDGDGGCMIDFERPGGYS